ncbi:MAG TPA: hypothetical protein P5234_02820 [Thermoanaerobaculaceae bacterium]|nr:hypothetical protein [Thermoanaerobaculaceae bacterium]HRS15161.1 hypothetical protein [Thermoanaerobaculaceae bacterium]
MAYLDVVLVKLALCTSWAASTFGCSAIGSRWAHFVLGLALLAVYVLVAIVLCRASSWPGRPATPIAVWSFSAPFLEVAAFVLARAVQKTTPLAAWVLSWVVVLVVIVSPGLIWLQFERSLTTRIQELAGLSH